MKQRPILQTNIVQHISSLIVKNYYEVYCVKHGISKKEPMVAGVVKFLDMLKHPMMSCTSKHKEHGGKYVYTLRVKFYVYTFRVKFDEDEKNYIQLFVDVNDKNVCTFYFIPLVMFRTNSIMCGNLIEDILHPDIQKQIDEYLEKLETFQAEMLLIDLIESDGRN